MKIKTRSGFTLVELLVVITIIVVLVGLSIPVAGTALNKAKEAKKVSNLRQIYTAAQLFANDYDGKLLPAADRHVSPGNWKSILAPYLGQEDGTIGEDNRMEVFIDPFFKEYDPEKPWLSGYAVNIKPGLPENTKQYVFWGTDQEWGIQYKVFAVTHPTKRIFLGDSDSYFFNAGGQAPGEALVTTRHDNGLRGMFLMYAGNIEKLNAAQAVLAATDPENYSTQSD
jgi:prepilin-type N-terminal cleavage/methylation domain-containing protein